MKKQIEFDFILWGQEGISVQFSGRKVISLHQHPNRPLYFYGLNDEEEMFYTPMSSLTMYQEVKPREIWVNEYKEGFLASVYYLTKDAAIKNVNSGAIRQVKFIEVLED